MTKHLQLSYALYERTSKGFGWAWYAQNLKESLLDDFLYRIQLPEEANDINHTQLRGGILKFAHVNGSHMDEHVVLYRFFKGSSDRGRSCMTMLTAWTTMDYPITPHAANGILGLFCTKTFQDVSNQSLTLCIEKPYSRIVNEPLPEQVGPLSDSLKKFLCGLNDEDYDYLLTIENEKHVLSKNVSGVGEFKKLEAEKRQIEQEKLKTEEARLHADKQKWEAQQVIGPPPKISPVPPVVEAIGASGNSGNRAMRIFKKYGKVSIGGCIVLATVMAVYGEWKFPGGPGVDRPDVPVNRRDSGTVQVKKRGSGPFPPGDYGGLRELLETTPSGKPLRLTLTVSKRKELDALLKRNDGAVPPHDKDVLSAFELVIKFLNAKDPEEGSP